VALAAGIDLGTTTSVIAAWDGGEASVVPHAEGAHTTPSVVAFTDSGERLVDLLARRQAILDPQGTRYSGKRVIGRRYEEIAQAAEQVTTTSCPTRTGTRGSRCGASCTPPRRSPRSFSAGRAGRGVRTAETVGGDGREPLMLETSLPGVFAAGNVRSGSVKRVASAAGEGARAVRLVHEAPATTL
jgi:hypothetical protein